MDIIIRTGFEKINCNIVFQPQTLLKGKLLVMAKHVREVKEFRKQGKSYLITARIIRQTSVNLTPYKTSLYINEERIIIKVQCDCVYNQSGKCKHVAALIYFINNVESGSKTSQEQQWGEPSARQFAKNKYSKGKYFEEMFPVRHGKRKVESVQASVDLSELKEESALRSILIADSQTSDSDTITNLLTSLVTEVQLNLEKEDCAECLKTFFINNEDFLVYSNNYPLQKDLEEFYNNNLVLSTESIMDLCSQTLSQSECEDWYIARRVRLSSSSNIHNIKVRSTKSIERLIHDILYPKKIDVLSTKYGLGHENNAKREYQKLNNCQVKKVGLIVSKNQPWLCTSLDGVVVQDGCITKLVEFKCPILCKNKPVIDILTNRCNVKYLQMINGRVELKCTHPYYTQIQMQLYVTGMYACDLFVYSPIINGCCTVTVHRDEQFIKKVILISEDFYFHHYLPAIYKTMC